jgi:hypothetical protein
MAVVLALASHLLTACANELTTVPPGGGGAGAAPDGGMGGASAAGGMASVGGGGGAPTCEPHRSLVFACAYAASIDDVLNEPSATFTGTLTHVELTDRAHACFHSPGLRFGAVDLSLMTYPVLVLQVESKGVIWDVAFSLPGVSTAGLENGDEVELALGMVASKKVYSSHLLVRRRGALVVAVGQSEIEDMVITPGREECLVDYSEACNSTRHAMEVAVGSHVATLSTGESAVVDHLLVTNNSCERNEEVECCCDSLPVEYLVGAVVAAP